MDKIINLISENNIGLIFGLIFGPYIIGAFVLLAGNLALTWINKKPVDMDISNFKSLIKTWVVGVIAMLIINFIRKGGQF